MCIELSRAVFGFRKSKDAGDTAGRQSWEQTGGFERVLRRQLTWIQDKAKIDLFQCNLHKVQFRGDLRHPQQPLSALSRANNKWETVPD
ncbi:hypothetical protein RRF57_005629 [Xylaria bambusicola]|uniref:Uncharacterized protein n=1 Tax=Xylaria bambusicola TaxID=326684 RepID=A0AAN7UYB3_9PEZI